MRNVNSLGMAEASGTRFDQEVIVSNLWHWDFVKLVSLLVLDKPSAKPRTLMVVLTPTSWTALMVFGILVSISAFVFNLWELGLMNDEHQLSS